MFSVSQITSPLNESSIHQHASFFQAFCHLDKFEMPQADVWKWLISGVGYKSPEMKGYTEFEGLQWKIWWSEVVERGIVIINGKLKNRDAVLVILCKLLPTHKNVLTEWVLVSHQKREMSQPVFITKKHPQAPWGKNSNIQYPFLMKTREKQGAAGEYTVIINGKDGTISEPRH